MSIETKVARIKSVRHAGSFKVRLRWLGEKSDRIVDLREIVHGVKGLRPLRDETVFAKVAVGEGGHSLAWPGDLDVGADRLWELDQEQNGLPGVAEFIHWRHRHAFSLNQASEALGLSRRMIAYYFSGERAVPRYVLLACKGWDAANRKAGPTASK
jgi:hypothetical protein